MNGGAALATATGGNGGNFGITAGNGGAANATATSTAMQGGAATATAAATGGAGGVARLISGIAGAADANSFATTINGNAAQAQSTASGSSGQAQATAQTNFGNLHSVQTVATSPVGGTGAAPAVAIAKAGGPVSLSNAISAGQSFSVVSGFGVGPLTTVALGAMGAGYGGTGQSLTYQESASFAAGGGIFDVDLLNSSAVGVGFDSAVFKIILNGNIFESQTFTNLALAEAFFSNNLINVPLAAGLNNIQLSLNETMSKSGGFAYNYAAVSVTPLPPTWTMMLAGLAGFGFVVYRHKKRTAAVASW
jgi:hypothetical protein